MTPESIKDLNTLMNNLLCLGDQYKACMRDFLASNDKGIADFLKAEGMERYILASKVADFIQEYCKTGVIYTGLPAPFHGKASPVLLQNLLEKEKLCLDNLDNMLIKASARNSEVTKQYLVFLRHTCQKEYNEVSGVIHEVIAVASDPNGMLQYNHFLSEMYKKGYE